MGAYENGGSIPIITKGVTCDQHMTCDQHPTLVAGEGVYIFDDRGKKCKPPPLPPPPPPCITHPPPPPRYIDGIAGLFTSQLGHGRQELADAYDRQAMTLGYFPIWSYAHPRAIAVGVGIR